MIRKILEQVAEEEDVSLSMVEDIYRSIWLITKRLIQSKFAPKVRLAGLGIFVPRVFNVERLIRGCIRKHRDGRMSLDKVRESVGVYWKIRKRLIKELNPNNNLKIKR